MARKPMASSRHWTNDYVQLSHHGREVNNMVATSFKFAKELLLFCGVGAVVGAGIGLIVFLHLGAPKTSENAGYVAGLFLKSRCPLDLISCVFPLAVKPLRPRFFPPTS